jgi:hypothetical protein
LAGGFREALRVEGRREDEIMTKERSDHPQSDGADEDLAIPTFPPVLIPTEDGEGPLTSEQSRAKASPDLSINPDPHASVEEFTDPAAQPPP